MEFSKTKHLEVIHIMTYFRVTVSIPKEFNRVDTGILLVGPQSV
jgi:hypothetical protein